MTTDTVPRVIRKMAFDWLLEADLPAEWEDAVAQEFSAALEDRKIEFVRTNEQGRPYDTPLVEWEHRDDEARQAAQQFHNATHSDCTPFDDLMEAAQR